MYATPRVRLTAVLFAALLAGCLGDGGRGSSGFDITENYIISRVLETQQCLTNEGLTFCPADQMATATPTPPIVSPTPTAVVSPTATATVSVPPHVDTGLADGALITCTRNRADAPCTLTFRFAGFGFAPGASFRVASRLRNPDGRWTLAEPPLLDAAVEPPMLTSAVSVAVPVDAIAPRLQFAVLVFLSPPAMPPAQFDELAESDTDFAFVTDEFGLEVITIGPPATPSSTPTQADATASPTPSAPTPTATATPPVSGPLITYLGVARADSVPLAPSDFDPDGRPIYIRPFGNGLSIIVEGRAGTSGRAVGHSAYDQSGGLPDLQAIVSRPLGDGSETVCDRVPPTVGGVPATTPFEFRADSAVVDAINDLGCRVDDGTGQPLARSAGTACTLDFSGEYTFVDATTTAQFCLPIAGQWAFPGGDTIVAARLRDVAGNLGSAREIVVRVVGSTEHSPTPVTSPIVTGAPASSTPAATTAAPSPTGSRPPSSVTDTPPVTPTPSPTFTPPNGEGPEITYFGLARADDRLIAASGTDASGRPVFRSHLGQGMELVLEAAPGPSRRAVGLNAYSPVALPDLQMILSRPLGDGSTALCDVTPPLIGGVPATDPLLFSDDPTARLAVNDLGCRVNDGTGQPLARTSSQQACTVSDAPSTTGFGFVNFESTVQYCLPIALAWDFPLGDTVVAARVRDVDGRISATGEIVVRVGP